MILNTVADASLKVLVIDDSLTELRVIVSLLRTTGYSIAIAQNGRDGIARANSLQPDVILCDLNMPDITGFAVLRRLKADPTTREIPVLFLTASTDVEDRIEGLKLGAVDYIDKPANAEEVLLRVGIHAARRNQYFGKSAEVNYSTSQGKIIRFGTDDAIAKACIDFLEKDPATTMNIDDIAASIGTYRKRLTDIFKSKFGTTVYGYLRDLRMAKAKEYLENGMLSIQSISEILGYSSPANFATAFKDRFGISPKEYRQESAERAELAN